MIQANELRIGNWVSNGVLLSYPAKPKYEQVSKLGGVDHLSFEPIALTWQIVTCNTKLECVSFEDDLTRYGVNGYEIIHWNINKGWEHDLLGEIIPVEHLHQLQNLYFALTGEELQINL